MYRIHLQEFEGPLDLLLYFIRRDELDIFDIPIAQIADEYLAYVRVLEQVDLDSVGDFLYMAALLINIKARMLLPAQEVDDEGEPIDPRRELVERLLEYVRFKEASQQLTTLQEQRLDLFTRGQASAVAPAWEAAQETTYEVSVFDLIAALRGVLTVEPSASTPTHEVRREEYTIEEQQAYIRARLAGAPRQSFLAAVRARSRVFIITTFLAVLEMARQGELRIVIPERPTDFYLEAVPPEAPDAAAPSAPNGTTHS